MAYQQNTVTTVFTIPTGETLLAATVVTKQTASTNHMQLGMIYDNNGTYTTIYVSTTVDPTIAISGSNITFKGTTGSGTSAIRYLVTTS